MTIGLVGQDQITTFTSPVNGTSPIDANVVRGNDNTVKTAHNVHDFDATIHFQSSLNAARPPAGVPGRKWLDTDTRRVYYDDGITWNEIGYISTGGSGTGIPGPVTVTGGGITVTGGGITASGDISAGGNVIAHTLFIADGTAAQNRGTVARTGNVTRWFVGANAAAETGANAGSDLSIAAYSDAGALLREDIVVKRDTGAITVTAPTVTLTGGLNTSTPVIVGTNPGGTGVLRVGGDINLGGTLRSSTGAHLVSYDGPGATVYVGSGNIDKLVFFGGGIDRARILTDGSFVIGTDPTGSGFLRVGGGARFSGGVTTGSQSVLAGAAISGGGFAGPTAGSFYKDSTYGLVIGLTPGAGEDFSLFNPPGNTQIMKVPTGTLGVTFWGPVVVGAEPGGSALIRTAGAIYAGGTLTAAAFLSPGSYTVIRSPDAVDAILVGAPADPTIYISATQVAFRTRAGSVQIAGISDTTLAGDTSVVLKAQDTGALHRIRTGPAGSGPGGSGRALFII